VTDDQLQIPVDAAEPEPDPEADEAAVEPPELPEGWLSEFGF
jgi:hypothetical protein